MKETDLITYPTWKKYSVLGFFIGSLNIRQRRSIFHLSRSQDSNSGDVFFPMYGITYGEFAVWYTLGESRRKNRKTATGE
jgi:hypothetical protein